MRVAPLTQEALGLDRLDGGRETGVGPKGGVLGERHGVVRPRAVHRGTGHPDDLADTHRGRRVEHAARAVDVHACHERLVGDRVHD
jgi:hypothetical protein